MATKSALEITELIAYRYKMPLKRAYGTARGKTTSSTNFIISAKGSHEGKAFIGWGESQPRHSLTGDGGKDRNAAWHFCKAAVDFLKAASIAMESPDKSISSIRSHMQSLTSLASENAVVNQENRPFRGTLLGIEVALLDIAARAHGIRLSQLLGEVRSDIHVSISTISSAVDLSVVGERVSKQVRFPLTRLKGGGDIDHNFALLDAAHEANQAQGRSKPLWIDINEAMNLQTATNFIKQAHEKMFSGKLPEHLIIEGPLPYADGLQHASLQEVANRITASDSAGKALTIEIMPDESIWDVNDLNALNAQGGCAAINIKAPKAGGLLASIDLARAAVDHNPQIKLCIGGMIGTSEITTWALHNLARSMPRIDYMTTVPPRNVEPISSRKSRYISPTSSQISEQRHSGLGTDVDIEKLRPYIMDKYSTRNIERSKEGTDSVNRKNLRPRKISWFVIVKGRRVQRVGYRQWLLRIAKRENVSGWVRNRSDGDVEALLRGQRVNLQKVTGQMLRGPESAVVSQITISNSSVVPHDGFRVREPASEPHAPFIRKFAGRFKRLLKK